MAYSGTTALSSAANPPRLLGRGIGYITGGSSIGPVIGTNTASSQGAVGGVYHSTDPTSYIVATGGSAYFSDGHRLGMRMGDIIMIVSSTAYASTVGVQLGFGVLLTTDSTAGWGIGNSTSQLLSTS
jgi:gentisate 1,2-dioxygenase